MDESRPGEFQIGPVKIIYFTFDCRYKKDLEATEGFKKIIVQNPTGSVRLFTDAYRTNRIRGVSALQDKVILQIPNEANLTVGELLSGLVCKPELPEMIFQRLTENRWETITKTEESLDRLVKNDHVKVIRAINPRFPCFREERDDLQIAIIEFQILMCILLELMIIITIKSYTILCSSKFSVLLSYDICSRVKEAQKLETLIVLISYFRLLLIIVVVKRTSRVLLPRLVHAISHIATVAVVWFWF